MLLALVFAFVIILAEALHILYIHPVPVVGMNKAWDVSELKLEGEIKTGIIGHEIPKLINHEQTVIQIAHVIIGHFENNQRFVNEHQALRS